MVLKLAYLYPSLLNLYGDQGNILCLKRRAEWRDIELEVHEIELGSRKSFENFDLFFIGGGQDAQQELVADDLMRRKADLIEAVENNAVILSICGGYQMLGNYYQTSSNAKVEGLGILDIHTKAPEDASRLIGNVVARSELKGGMKDKTLVGFENHSGRTYIKKKSKTKALAIVEKGYGNNGEDQTEGAVYKNVFGTYLHGSVLPKNPHFADELLLRAIKRQDPKAKLKKLKDEMEQQAHKVALSL